MSTNCHPAPENKKEYLTEIGSILVRDYGEKKFYRPIEVKEAHKKSSRFEDLDFSCWAMSTYSSHEDFDSYHHEIGEVCDYASMKIEMLQGLSLSDDPSWIDTLDFDMDLSWLDFGEVFGNILEGAGDFIAGVFDGM